MIMKNHYFIILAKKPKHMQSCSKKINHALPKIFGFLINRAGWKVTTKIYFHYTFEQERLKKDFILMNQISRLKARNKV